MKETIRYDEPQPKIIYGVLGDTYVFANEREVQEEVFFPSMEGEEQESQTVTRYEYDVRHFPLRDKTPERALQALKELVISEVDNYDNSDAVNIFSVNGIPMWLDKATRNGLAFRFQCEKKQGMEQTTLWYGSTPLTLELDTAVQMLEMLEVYASKCYDVTAAHKSAIKNAEGIDEVSSYDYRQGYPAKLAF